MGETLARNFLKEIGIYEFGKPDTHLIKIFQSFDPSVVESDLTTFDKALLTQSKIAGCNPYKLDKILWLICSGKYYLDGLKISEGKTHLRDNFIKELNFMINHSKITL